MSPPQLGALSAQPPAAPAKTKRSSLVLSPSAVQGKDQDKSESSASEPGNKRRKPNVVSGHGSADSMLSPLAELEARRGSSASSSGLPEIPNAYLLRESRSGTRRGKAIAKAIRALAGDTKTPAPQGIVGLLQDAAAPGYRSRSLRTPRRWPW